MVQRTTVAAGDESPRRNDGRNMATSHLSPAWIKLFELCRETPFGQFHELPFQDGEPVLPSQSKPVITVKLGKDDGPRKTLAEIAHHERAISLRRLLARWRNGTLRRLTVNDSIPDVADIVPSDQA